MSRVIEPDTWAVQQRAPFSSWWDTITRVCSEAEARDILQRLAFKDHRSKFRAVSYAEEDSD